VRDNIAFGLKMRGYPAADRDDVAVSLAQSPREVSEICSGGRVRGRVRRSGKEDEASATFDCPRSTLPYWTTCRHQLGNWAHMG